MVPTRVCPHQPRSVTRPKPRAASRSCSSGRAITSGTVAASRRSATGSKWSRWRCVTSTAANDGDRGGEVQAPDVLAGDRDAEGGVREGRADGGREPAALAAEDEQVVLAVARRGVRARGAGREAEEASGRPRGREGVPARVA